MVRRLPRRERAVVQGWEPSELIQRAETFLITADASFDASRIPNEIEWTTNEQMLFGMLSGRVTGS